MNKVFILPLFILIFFGVTNGQSGAQKFSHDVGLITYYKSGQLADAGTGTLIAKYSSPTTGCVFLVTNKHVIPLHKDADTILFRIGETINLIDSFITIPIPIYNKAGVLYPYVKFNNDGNDICVLIIDSFFQQYGLMFLATNGLLINYTSLLTSSRMKEEKIGIGTDVFYLGYPSYFFDARNISPIARKGFIASDPTTNYYFSSEFRKLVYAKFNYQLPDIWDGFLIDGNVFGGSSGSLVCLDPSRVSGNTLILAKQSTDTYILGILTQTFFDLDNRISTPHYLNLGAVISAEKIKETIDLFPVN